MRQPCTPGRAALLDVAQYVPVRAVRRWNLPQTAVEVQSRKAGLVGRPRCSTEARLLIRMALRADAEARADWCIVTCGEHGSGQRLVHRVESYLKTVRCIFFALGKHLHGTAAHSCSWIARCAAFSASCFRSLPLKPPQPPQRRAMSRTVAPT